MKCSLMLVNMVFVFIVAGCSGPMGPIPGGTLKGTPGTLESDWSFAANTDHLQLETRNSEGEGHSVNVWSGVVDGRLFVPTSLVRGAELPTDRAWVRHVTANPQVRVRIDGTLYPGVVSRVLDPALENQVKLALMKKYVSEPDERTAVAWIFEVKEATDGESY